VAGIQTELALIHYRYCQPKTISQPKQLNNITINYLKQLQKAYKISKAPDGQGPLLNQL